MARTDGTRRGDRRVRTHRTGRRLGRPCDQDDAEVGRQSGERCRHRFQLPVAPALNTVGEQIATGFRQRHRRDRAEQSLVIGRAPALARLKPVTARYFLEQVVPEALGLEASARGGAALLYALDAGELA